MGLLFGLIVATSMLAPAAAGGLLTWSWQGAVWAFFWAGLVRISLLHHVTWSINSICHVVGERPFELRNGDKAATSPSRRAIKAPICSMPSR